MKNFIREFKTFALRGNVVDLAIAVVVGGAFGKIVSSLVDDIIMPVVGVLTGGIDFGTLSITLKQASASSPEVVLRYGLFLNTVVTFLIVAFAIFVMIRQMNRFIKKEEAKPSEPPKTSREEELLTEIRDLLKNQQP